MSKSIHGIVSGNSIRLDEPLNLAEGTPVEVLLRPMGASQQERDMRLKSLFGSCRESANDIDEFLEANAQQRRLARREIEP